MIFAEPTTIQSQIPWTQQILSWLNGLTLPAIVLAVFGAARWLTKKEDEFKAGMTAAKAELEVIKTNHLHHMQESLNEIKQAQIDMVKEMGDQTKDIVAATNSSKDAIVNAILTIRK